MDGRRQRADRPFRDEHAVSEVLGVIMLLAMVMTIMAGVIAFLQPYLTDFEDNVNWKSANGIADRLDDRLAVAVHRPRTSAFVPPSPSKRRRFSRWISSRRGRLKQI